MSKKFCFGLFLLIFINMYLHSTPLKLFGEELFTRNSATHILSAGFLYCYSYEMLENTSSLDKSKSVMVSFSITNMIGLFKEIFDEKQRGNKFSYKDIFCNLVGSAMMYAMWR